MDLIDAYRVLDVAPGSSKVVVRDAWILLVKVWHPDRHQNDPKIKTRTERKLP